MMGRLSRECPIYLWHGCCEYTFTEEWLAEVEKN